LRDNRDIRNASWIFIGSATTQDTTEKEFTVTTRLLIFVVFVTCLTSIGIAQDDTALSPKVGDPVSIELTGKPAAAYLRLFNQPVPNVPDGDFGVPLEARIIRVDRDNLIAEFQAAKPNGSDAPQLVTISASFRRRDLTSPSQYRTPNAKAATNNQRLVQATIARHESLPKIRRHSFDGIMIRVWSLSDQITE
jgi:hypothetical protein